MIAQAARRFAAVPAGAPGRTTARHSRCRSPAACRQCPDRNRTRRTPAQRRVDRVLGQRRALRGGAIRVGHRLLEHWCCPRPAMLPWRQLDAPGARRRSGLRSGGRAMPQHGADHTRERRTHCMRSMPTPGCYVPQRRPSALRTVAWKSRNASGSLV